jgi:hypothetical protein
MEGALQYIDHARTVGQTYLFRTATAPVSIRAGNLSRAVKSGRIIILSNTFCHISDAVTMRVFVILKYPQEQPKSL